MLSPSVLLAHRVATAPKEASVVTVVRVRNVVVRVPNVTATDSAIATAHVLTAAVKASIAY